MVLAGCWTTGACRKPAQARGIAIESSISPSPPVVGRNILTLNVLDAERQPVRGATLRVEGHMSHPGMAPVLATAIDRGNGRYEAELDFPMRGDWILLVSGSLSNGAAIRHRIDLPGVRPSG